MAAFEKIWNGDFLDETICIPHQILNTFLAIIFPPLAVFVNEYQNGFQEPSRIFISILYTLLFYFPGVIYALKSNKCKKK